MSFKTLAPWEEILFKGIEIPNNVTIPVNDEFAYLSYPNLRWMFNKMELCRTQNIKHAPVGVEPSKYPVFMKPIINLYGMGMEARRIDEESDESNKPGFFWMEYLEGPHISTDVVYERGIPVWWGHTLAHKLDDTRFEMWEFRGNIKFELIEEYITKWVEDNIGKHHGVLNFETMNGKIIDAHPRMSTQFVDLYSEGWLQSVANLYAGIDWMHEEKEEIGYSMPIWSDEFIDLVMSENKFSSLCEKVISIQITTENFYQPPQGYRIAVINGRDKDIVISVANSIKKALREHESGWWDKLRIHHKKTVIEDIIVEEPLSKED